MLMKVTVLSYESHYTLTKIRRKSQCMSYPHRKASSTSSNPFATNPSTITGGRCRKKPGNHNTATAVTATRNALVHTAITNLSTIQLLQIDRCFVGYN